MKDVIDTPSLSKCNSSRSYIPEDQLIQCFERLPVKSLIRFKAVSKSWNNLISSDGFAEMYFRHSRTNEKLLGFGLDPDKLYPVMSLLKLPGSKDAEFGDEFQNVLSPFRPQPFGPVDVEASCNGLLVLSVTSIPGFMLANPATRKFKRIDLPSNKVKDSYSIGFCFISETKDYKIIASQNTYGKRSSSGTSYRGWVYSLNSDSWKKLDVAFPYLPMINGNGTATVLNECVNWIADEDADRIAAFDAKNEVLQCFSLPVPRQWGNRFGRLLTMIEGSLSVLMKYSGLEVWRINEYGVEASWTNLFIINTEHLVRPLGSWKERMILFISYNGKGEQLFSYDPSTRERERFPISPIWNLQVISYVGSMESVEGGLKRISLNRS